VRPISIFSPRSASRILVWPQLGLSRARPTTSERTSAGLRGRPVFRAFELSYFCGALHHRYGRVAA
jgi:hypothetical protein